VFIAGPFQAGKTTFIHTLDPNAMSVERDMKELYRGKKATTTVGFDLGRVIWVRKSIGSRGLIVPKKNYHIEKKEYDGWITKEIELRGAPGQLHFKTVRETFMGGADGVFFVLDSSDTATIGAAVTILSEIEIGLHGVPIEIIANKQDLPDAAIPSEVARWLGVNEAFGMSAKDRESCKDAVGSLLLRIEAH